MEDIRQVRQQASLCSIRSGMLAELSAVATAPGSVLTSLIRLEYIGPHQCQTRI